MKMKLLISLLVLCLAFSIGPAMAQTDTYGNMGKSMAGDMNKTSEGMDKAIVVVAGNVTGNVTYNVNEMNGMAGKMNEKGKTKTRNITGSVLIIKDIEKGTENIVMVGKMDGMTKQMTITGKIDHENRMAGKNEKMEGMTGENENMTGMSEESENMTGMSEENENMAGEMDNEKVIVTGDITCNMAGKMVIIGKMSDMREMTGEKKVKAGMAGYKAGAVAGKMKIWPGWLDIKPEHSHIRVTIWEI